MPKLTKVTETIRVTQAIKAMTLLMDGMTKEEACAEAGISPYQFNKWVGSESEAIEAYQIAVVEAERQRMADITNAQAIILSQLVKSVADPDFKDQDLRLKTLKYLDQLRDKLEAKHGVHSQLDKAQEYVLSGPNTRIEKSQMVIEHELSRSTVNVKTRPDGSLDISLPVQEQIVNYLPGLNDKDEEEDDSFTGSQEESDLLS